MSEWDILEIALKLINVCGLHPQKLAVVRFMFNLTVLSIVSVLVVFHMFVNFHMSQLEAITYIYYTWIKFGSILMLNRRPLRTMLETMRQFRPNELSSKENAIYRKYNRWLKGYVGYLVVCLLLVITGALALETQSILEPYEPKFIPGALLFFAELYVLLLAYFSVVGASVIASTLILCVAQQLAALNKKIRTYDLALLKEEDTGRRFMKEFKEDVAYHIFLLKCVGQLNEILSTPLLLQLLGDVYVLCINMYGVSSPKSTVVDLFRHGVISVEVIVAFIFLFGYPAQLIMETAEEVGQSVYCHCTWYLPNILSVRKDLLIIIVRSQYPLTITAGGFTDVNNRTILFLVKTAYSFYAYLQTVS